MQNALEENYDTTQSHIALKVDSSGHIQTQSPSYSPAPIDTKSEVEGSYIH